MSLAPTEIHEPNGPVSSPLVHAFYDPTTATWTYLVIDPTTKQTLLIDSVLGYDPASGRFNDTLSRGLVEWVQAHGLKVSKIIETHVHADHVTAAQVLKKVHRGLNIRTDRTYPTATSLSPARIHRGRRRERAEEVRADIWFRGRGLWRIV
jgi:glyoxylase-like metal-dependent hydrolase (beta-lactamase superfamily II)